MLLEVRNVVKTFGEKRVLDRINLQVKSGAALGLLGRNGAGKTTTIRIVMGVFPADSGEILLDGKPISKSGATFGYLPEERGLYPKKLIGDQLIYLARLRGLTRADAAAAVKRWLARLGMEEVYAKKLDTLSKGNQQKIQLASTLLHDPDIVILDEPFSGLDPVNASLLKDVVRELVAAGKTVIFSSHQMGYVEEFCDNIAILNGGRIVLDGNLHDIKMSYPRNRILVSLDKGDMASSIKAALCQAGLDNLVTKLTPREHDVILQLIDPDKRGQVLAALSGAGLAVDRFEVLTPTLEQIFVEKAGETA